MTEYAFRITLSILPMLDEKKDKIPPPEETLLEQKIKTPEPEGSPERSVEEIFLEELKKKP
ncbi:MAG: hypothetical protein A3D19_03105 [Deltaproteobacteria bacterium RIFCSPHIGHO2_02_FULL_38_15]|nr:MAG: hypothetical protein A3D19_03105 [Deltaproteobacteria bacterium RIFCSPHIGHO2_02_FULL_38_15]OGQ30039.1 MAG: hypothetical protein A3A72_00150 [Deltaproteobacteria bacterium RIFCSPLOWO2_01_FULL_38_9]HBQ20777.1 hypothetical protein [Deltaproteobacteria bacterium]